MTLEPRVAWHEAAHVLIARRVGVPADLLIDTGHPAGLRMRDRGGFEQLRDDLRLRKALDEIVAGVKRIPLDLARAREKLWTPEKEKGGREMKIWTPGSEEKQ